MSKIVTADDLARVDTLGFRGEALHAIGAVSSLILTTCERGNELGTRVGVFAGEIVESAPASHQPGTTVEVRNLFLNLPVRRGFLGTQRAEANAVSAVVESLALSRPGVGFSLRSEGRGVLVLPAAADLRERISQVHGLALARTLVALDDPVVWGFVSPISVSFPTRRYTHVAVNGRVVEADSFGPAVSRAYADLLPKGRHPAAFLRLELGPGEVDVNVHPAKSAVRLRGGRSAYPLVVGTIRAALAPERDGGGLASPEGELGELAPIGQFAGSRAHGRDAGLKGSGKTRQPSKARFLIIQDPVSLCDVTRCSDRFSGARRGIGRFSRLTAQFYAGCCIRVSENASSTTLGE
jgi:DNA mismatch repair protein MutL